MKEYEIGDKITLEAKRAKEGCLGCFFRDINAEYCHAYCSPTTILVQTDEYNQVSRKAIDWEQRRYEIAKDMLSAMYLDEGQESREGNHNIDFEFKEMNSCASEAVRWADVLIEELKKTSK